MAGADFTGRYTAGITLSNAATQNPATLSNYIYVGQYSGGAAIRGNAGTAWTVSNQGLLIDYASNGSSGTGTKKDLSSLNNPGGIYLQSGGLVINGNTGAGGQGQITGGGPFYAVGRLEETAIGVAIEGGPGIVVNDGVIKSAGTGVYLAAGGTLLNGAATDRIAYINAVSEITGGAGTVVNYGTLGHGGLLGGLGVALFDGGLLINAPGAYVRNYTTIGGAAGTIVNAGTMNHGVALAAGGLLENAATGTVAYGLALGAAASIVNAGSIGGGLLAAGALYLANTGTIGPGSITIAGGGTIVNGTAGARVGLIIGTTDGLTIAGNGALVTNFGTISGGIEGIRISGTGATVVNAGTVTESGGYTTGAGIGLAAPGTLLNTGTVFGTPIGLGLDGGTAVNQGLVSVSGIGRATVAGGLFNGAVAANSGTFSVTGQYAIGAELAAGATLNNSGLVLADGVAEIASASPATLKGIGIDLAGGALVNTGTIIGTTATYAATEAVGVLIGGTLGVSVVNAGAIRGGFGLYAARSERVGTNGSYAYIDPGLSTTLVDSGVITGTSGYAVRFGDGASRLILQPGAQLIGTVAGGTGSNTLEFATGANPFYGVLGGLGGTVINFATMLVDPGADWDLAGTIAAATSLVNNGQILANQGTLVVQAPLATGTGTIALAGHGVAALLGTVGANETARFLDLVGTLEIGTLGRFAGTIAGFAGGDDIVLLGVTASHASYANHRLTITNGASLVGTIALAGSFAGDHFTVAMDSAGNADITTDAPCFVTGTRLLAPDGPIAVEQVRPGMRLLTASGAARPVVWVGSRPVACRRHPRPELVEPVRIARDAFAPGVPLRPLWLSPDHAVFLRGVLIPIKHLINGASIAQVTRASVTYCHVELDWHDILLAEGLPVESYLDTGNRSAFAQGGAALTLHPDFAPRGWDAACAPLVQAGALLAEAKATLFRRAGLAEVTPAPQLCVAAVPGRGLVAEILAAGAWRYRVPPGSVRLALRSPGFVPAFCRAAALDRRRLGVRLLGVAIDGRTLALDDPAFAAGFHAVETTAEGACRWTDGAASLVLPRGARIVELTVGDDAAAVGALGLRKVG